jgi:hypothetical protein
VCRQAGYFEHAAYLAKRWSRHEDYLRIQIEDTGNFTDALAYLRHLGPEAVSLALILKRLLIMGFSRRKIILRGTAALWSQRYPMRPLSCSSRFAPARTY